MEEEGISLNSAPVTAVELRRRERPRRCCTLPTWTPHDPLQVTQCLGLFQTRGCVVLLKRSLTEHHP